MDIIADLILELLGKVVRHSKSPRTQTVVDILVASVFLGVATWSAVGYFRQGNDLMAVIFGAVVVIFILLVVCVVFRRIFRRREK